MKRVITSSGQGYKLRWGMVSFWLICLLLVSMPAAMAKPDYFSQIPQGFQQSCNLCHSQPPALNQFGHDFAMNGKSFAGLANPADKKEDTGATGVEAKAPKIELLLPAKVTRGEKIQLSATVTLDGKPVTDQPVQFSEVTDFFIKGNMDLGQARTNAEGKATINYWPRALEEQVTLTASVPGDAQIKAAEVKGTLALAVVGPLAERAEGLHLPPFVSVWLVIALLLVAWGIFGYALIGAVRLGRVGTSVGKQMEETLETKKQQRA